MIYNIRRTKMICIVPIVLMTLLGRTRVCYQFEGTSIGCFDRSAPFDNTPCLPDDPANLDIEFLLFTRVSPNTPTKVSVSEIRSLVTNKPTKFLLLGYKANCGFEWVVRLKDELLTKDDFNVFCVDYAKATDSFYSQAIANARVLGASISVYIDELTSQVGIPASDVHLISDSLGAQVAGYTGQGRTSPIGRISGLDPAGLGFMNQDTLVRLDPSDATFVDVIHTDGFDVTNPTGIGNLQVSGHADFYPNLGRAQPGCLSLVEIASAVLLDRSLTNSQEVFLARRCDHLRAFEYYVESINSACPFSATACSLDDADVGACSVCLDASCLSNMGFNADQNQRPASYFLATNAMSPFCVS